MDSGILRLCPARGSLKAVFGCLAVLVSRFAGPVSALAESRPASSSWKLPGGTADGVSMDYLAYDPGQHRLWVPAGNTGRVDVIDVATGAIHEVGGFPTREVQWHGKARNVGPSAAAVGEGVVFVGNRGDSTICAVSSDKLARLGCLTLSTTPDGLAYVGVAHEVWVTAPREKSLLVIDATSPEHPTMKAKIPLPGEPEALAVDERRGAVFTNLEDANRTLEIDVHSREIRETWEPKCGAEGPRGLAMDRKLDLLFVACHDGGVQVLDPALHGALAATVPTGSGLDNIDYAEATHRLFAAASAGQLTVAPLDEHGKPQRPTVVETAPGARCVVADEQGRAYVADSAGSRIIVVQAR